MELEDIFGGDGLFAIDVLVKSKSIEVSATDAKFDLDAIQLMMGSTVQEQVKSYVWVLNEQSTVAAGVSILALLKPSQNMQVKSMEATVASRFASKIPTHC